MKIELTRDKAVEFRDIVVDLIHDNDKGKDEQFVLGKILNQLVEQIEGSPSIINHRTIKEITVANKEVIEDNERTGN